jgi:hypothetical protein
MINARSVLTLGGFAWFSVIVVAAAVPAPHYHDGEEIAQQFRLLPEVPEEYVNQQRAAQVGDTSRLFQIGLSRPIEAKTGVNPGVAGEEWILHADGWRSFAVSVASLRAKALRLHLEFLRLEHGARLVIYNPIDRELPPLVVEAGDVPASRELWTGTLFGDRAVVEAQIPPGVEPGAVEFRIAELSHLYASSESIGKLESSCQRDVACYGDYRRYGSGVARMAFIDQGNTYVCTGALIAGAKGGNYFLTAHHCIRNQDLASTIELFWFYEAEGCGGAVPELNQVPVTRGGAELLASSLASDAAFLRLRQKPPGGANPLEWSTAAPQTNDLVICIHHPEGTQKRLSRGGLYGTDPAYWGVQWTAGATEDGSSGSPLLNARGQVIGQLDGGYHGPGSSCANPSAPDQYGRFDVTYQVIQPWLSGKSSPGGFAAANATYNGLIYDPGTGIGPDKSGYFTLRTTSSGKVTGKLMLRGVSSAFNGSIDVSGQATLTVKSKRSQPLSLHLQFNPNDLSQVEGAVTDGSFSAQLYGGVARPARNLGSAPGQYTVVLPGVPGSGVPAGDSYATLTVSSQGQARLAGSLADGTKFSQSTGVVNGQLPLYAALYRGAGLLVGWVGFAENAASDAEGDVIWISPAYSSRSFYTEGFVNNGRAVASRVQRTANMAGFLDGLLTLAGGGLPETISVPVAVDGRGRIFADRAAKLKLSVAANGTFRGSVANPETGRALPFSGVVFQREALGAGYFLNQRQSGRVFLGGNN